MEFDLISTSGSVLLKGRDDFDDLLKYSDATWGLVSWFVLPHSLALPTQMLQPKKKVAAKNMIIKYFLVSQGIGKWEGG